MYFPDMDDTDRKIIAFVQENGRASYAEIGAAAGLSVSAANDRLRKLQASGAIRRWTAEIDPLSAGLGILAFVHVLLERPEHSAPFLERVAGLPEIQECHHVTGEWNYLLKVRTGTMPDLERLLTEGLKALPGVVRSHTAIALSSPKESALLPMAFLPRG